jgi:hypothetical protein
MDFDSTMKAFADKFSLAIEPKDGAVVLDFNSIPVSFMDTGDAVVIHAPIGEIGQDAEAGLLHSMLAANAALADDGFVLCQDNATDGFAIVRSAPVETLDAESLSGIVAVLVSRATEWSRRLAEAQYTISDN